MINSERSVVNQLFDIRELLQEELELSDSEPLLSVINSAIAIAGNMESEGLLPRPESRDRDPEDIFRAKERQT